MISDEDIKYFASVHAGGAIGDMACELLQLRVQLAEAEADRKMLLTALRSQVVTAETQRQLLKEGL